MQTTGKLIGAEKRGNKVVIAFEIDSSIGVGELRDIDVLDIKAEKHRERRSRNANSYMWEIIHQMHNVLRLDEKEIYKQCLRDAGVKQYYAVKNEAVPDALNALTETKASGTGDFAEVQFGGRMQGYTTVVHYVGSSKYNSKQMSALLDYVVEQAKSYGIDTMTPEEIERLKNAQ